jgi:protein involved in polysaccharide export with SLBB domain
MKWLVVMCGLAALMLGACVQQTKGPSEPVLAETDVVVAAPSVEDAAYVIEAGDIIDVKSASRPEVTSVAPVRADGTAALKVVGYARAAGSTTAQLVEILNELYKAVPGYEAGVADLTVEVKRGLYLITGEVTNGGFRAYTEGLTLYDAVTSAGKLTGKALKDRVYLNRKGVEGREIIRYSKLDQLKDVLLKENDWVVIPYKVDFILH